MYGECRCSAEVDHVTTIVTLLVHIMRLRFGVRNSKVELHKALQLTAASFEFDSLTSNT